MFLDLPDLLRSFDNNRPLEPWLMRVVVNRTLRQESRENRLLDLQDVHESEEWAAHWADSTSNPESAIQQRELEDELWTANAETERRTTRRTRRALLPANVGKGNGQPRGCAGWDN